MTDPTLYRQRREAAAVFIQGDCGMVGLCSMPVRDFSEYFGADFTQACIFGANIHEDTPSEVAARLLALPYVGEG